ncbi:MAG: hypothetical protein ACI8YQ_001684 [Polaribacter sp.]|jgi:hypothetical protein
MKAVKRYTFIDYENLKKIKLRSLEKLSERLYILVNSEHQSIPLKLVRKIQRLKSDVRWIIANTGSADHVNFHIAFLMGKLHSKVDKKIAFVVISNDNNIDAMINCVTDAGRLCTRVKRTGTKGASNHAKDQVKMEDMSAKSDEKQFPFEDVDRVESLKDKTIAETIRRLMNSSKPPVNIAELKHYIERSNQEIARYLNISEIIEEMIRRKEIRVVNHQIIYNFLPA